MNTSPCPHPAIFGFDDFFSMKHVGEIYCLGTKQLPQSGFSFTKHFWYSTFHKEELKEQTIFFHNTNCKLLGKVSARACMLWVFLEMCEVIHVLLSLKKEH